MSIVSAYFSTFCRIKAPFFNAYVIAQICKLCYFNNRKVSLAYYQEEMHYEYGILDVRTDRDAG